MTLIHDPGISNAPMSSHRREATTIGIGRVYAFELTCVRRHGLWLCEPKLPLVCKCASVQTVSGQQSSASTSAEGGSGTVPRIAR